MLFRSVYDALVAQEGLMQAELLISKNPQAIVEDRPLEAAGPLLWKVSFADRLRGLLGRHVEDRA